ncbi:MAG: efflux RND transporter periplasmic adaptor subunit [Candidatus Eisenbacteria bacterium]|uniref:Efflux RND transporter periplasmic adaptor subunit n=1 Tax=Eiseniibacteriota bacterium TaxID=2212470 RepID=A0A933SET8_UNCEI|nr:efflux RND transporter periplasmic adaptor subunit [Candidatus Eisenbacteria bacterium]
MSRRLLQTIAAIVVFLAAIGFYKFNQIQGAIAQGKAFKMPPEAVTTAVARTVDWPATLESVGSVAPVQGVVLSADLPGIVESISFESGARVKAGQVLVTLDARQERAQLAGAEAQLQLAKAQLERSKKLLETQNIAQADFDVVAAQFQIAEAAVGQSRALLERKTIRAPFAGVTGIRQVNVGQFLSGGDPVVPLQSLDPVYVNFAVPQQELGTVHVGSVVEVTADTAKAVRYKGRVTAVNAIVDESTRNVQVQATLPNPRALLRPGMFVDVHLALGGTRGLLAVPTSAVNYAPYGNSVFVVGDQKGPDGKTFKGVKQQFVVLGGQRGDQVAVLKGLKDGDEVVSSGVFKLRSGAAVVVNNAVTPGNSADPKPEEN